jgi:hypothetical protein
MTASKTFQGLLLGLSVLLAAGAFAADKGSLELNSPASISGKQLAAGDYKLKWEGDGPTVQLNILKGNKVVVTTRARVVNVDHPSERNESVVNRDGNGSRSLAEIRLSGKKYVLAIDEDTGAPGGSSGSAR